MSKSPNLLCKEITFQIIGASRDVYHTLGWGFLESVYLSAMAQAIAARGLRVRREAPLQVHFHGQVVGNFRADLLVEEQVLVELKAVDRLIGSHEAQLLNYLRASNLPVGLLFNFGHKFEQRRLVWTSTHQCLKDLP
jgi:GxxExxY protein